MNDYQITISRELKSKLSAQDTFNLFSMGFQFRRSNTLKEFPMYLKALKDSLDSAFGLKTEFVVKEDSIVVIKKIKEGPRIAKSVLRNYYSLRFEGDTVDGKGISITSFCESLNRSASMEMIFVPADKSTSSYDLHIIIDRSKQSRSAIV